MFGRNRKEARAQSDNGQPRDNYAKALDYEASTALMLEKSERKGWRFGWIMLGLVVMEAIAIAAMLPLKESVPYVVRVDQTTGAVDLVTRATAKDVAFDEVLTKYWVGRYVRARENYDWYTLQTDYTEVGLLSSADVGRGYAALFEGANALDKKYGANIRAKVDLVSVVPTGDNTATVRFIKTTTPVEDDRAPLVQRFVATVAYEFRNPSIMKDSLRLINPLGFQVTSYRVDAELVGGDAQ